MARTLAAVGALILAGCSSGGEEPGLVLADQLTAYMDEADYGCLGTRTAPAPEESTTFAVQFEDLLAGPVGERGTPGEVCFSFYDDNVLPASDSCSDSGMIAEPSTVDEQYSTADVTDPDGGWFALRSYPDEVNLGVVTKNAWSQPSGAAQVFATFKPATADGVAEGFDHMRDPDTAAFFGMVRDCGQDAVSGAEVRVLLDGELLRDSTTPEGPFYGYFTAESQAQPDPALDNSRRLWFAGNIPIDADRATLVACGNID
ncbi:MAG: hypothetical protein ACOC9T_03955, partial [Myxococcota bacterium]